MENRMRTAVSRFFAAAALCAVLMASSLAASAQVVLFGTPGADDNAFPFGGSFLTGTRYQQVYNASKFAGPIVIEEVSFFATYTGGSFVANTFSLSLSTTSKAVNGLSTVFTDNVGADNTLIETKALSGPMPTKWTFSGGTFLYDPSLGNLLVDIIPAAPVPAGVFLGFADAMNDTFGTDSSRMHDFGTGFDSQGLVTEFKGYAPTNNVVPEPGAFALLFGFALVGGMALRRRR